MSKKLAALLIAAVLPLGAQAATETWDFSSAQVSIGTSTSYGNEYKAQSDSNTDVRVTGWSDTGALVYTGPNNSAEYKIETASVRKYSGGFGVKNRERDGHTIDNGGNDTDMVLLSFTKEVSLSGLTVGWVEDYTTNISVAAYGGSGTPSESGLLGETWSTLQDWQLAQTLTLQTSQTRTLINSYQSITTNLKSKFWLIGACNFAFSGNICHDCEYSGFKLASVVSSVTNGGGQVPSPASIFLVLAGLVAIRYSRNAKTARLSA